MIVLALCKPVNLDDTPLRICSREGGCDGVEKRMLCFRQIGGAAVGRIPKAGARPGSQEEFQGNLPGLEIEKGMRCLNHDRHKIGAANRDEASPELIVGRFREDPEFVSPTIDRTQFEACGFPGRPEAFQISLR